MNKLNRLTPLGLPGDGHKHIVIANNKSPVIYIFL